MRSRARLLTLAIAAAAVASQFSLSAAQAATVKGKSGPLAVTMHPSTHHPKVNAKWPLTVIATLRGKPVKASAEYEFLYSGTVVSTQYPRNNKHFTFTGMFHDTLLFPSASYGEPLTLQVVITASGHHVDLDWAISSVH
jgi:hypothetical protein